MMEQGKRAQPSRPSWLHNAINGDSEREGGDKGIAGTRRISDGDGGKDGDGDRGERGR